MLQIPEWSPTPDFRKRYSGGGEVVAHSSVHASHGSSPANLAFLADHKRLIVKQMAPTA